MNKLTLSVGSCVVACLMGVGSSALGATINYGDLNDFGNGGTVEYLQVTESSITDPLPLYGAPSISVNTLDFDPPGFGAFSSGGGGDLTDGTLSFGIRALGGYTVEDVMLSEGGAYTLLGLGTSNTYVSVSVPVFFDVIEIDGVAVNPIQLITSMTFTPAGGAYYLPSDGPVNGAVWTGTLDIDVDQFLIDEEQSFEFGATAVELQLDNSMYAQSEDGTTAFIDKKDFKGLSITAIVPEPSVFALSLLGLAGLLMSCRRMK